MTVSWVELLRRSGMSLDSLAEALHAADTAGLSRAVAPPWMSASDDTRLRFRRLARVAVDRLGGLDDRLLEQLLAGEGAHREQLAVQAKRIKELERRLEKLGAL